MQDSSSGGNRNPRNRNSRPRSDSRGGSRSRSGDRRDGSPRREGGRGEGGRRNDGPDEFRPSDSASRPPRRESSKPAPRPTAFQKFIKFITFGLVDPTPKKSTTPRPVREPREPRESREPREPRAPRPAADGSGGPEKKRERRPPVYVEPTGPRLYIGNLSYDVTNADLETLFSAHGSVVEAAVVTQTGSDRSKGFAFVEMGSLEEAKAAATALNDHEFQGRKMLVTGAKSEGRNEEGTRESSRGDRPERAPRSGDRGERRERGERGERGGREERPRGGGRTRSGDYDEIDKPSRQVRPLVIETVTSPSLSVLSVNADASETDVTDLFAGIGTITLREETGSNVADHTKDLRIDLADTAEAQKAVELLNGKCFMGHELRVTGVKAEG